MALVPTATLINARSSPRVRTITTSDLNWALAQGWRDFLDKRGDVVVLALIYPLIGFLAAAVTANGRILPLLFPLLAGLTILGPAAATGFYEIARRRDVGLDASWLHFLDPLRRSGSGTLWLLMGGLLVLFLAWLAAAWGVAAITIGVGASLGLRDFLRAVFTTPAGWIMIVLGNIVGFVFAFITLELSLVAFPMAVDGRAGPVTAVLTSIDAFKQNPRQVSMWGLRVVALLVLGCLPAFIGLAVVLPVLGFATWRLYTRLIDR